MKKNFSLFILAISFIFFTTSITFKLKYNKFSCNKALDDIKYLSSYELEGRLPGTEGNVQAANYIEKEFKKAGLKPLKNNDYKQYFTLKTPKHTEGSSNLCIKDSSGKVIKSFSYSVDFKEDFINFKKSSLEFSSNDEIMIFPSSLLIFKDKTSYLFYVPKENNFNFRSSFSSDFDSSFAVRISRATYDDIIYNIRNGNLVSCSLPYKIEEANVCNVAGIIKGRDSSLPPLVFGAHFDHLGLDNEILYAGALDNASGTSFLLELARTYGSMTPPVRDIIFVAFNAEEYGLLGSKNFVQENKDILKNAKVLNFDMMGSNKEPALTLMTSKDNNLLVNEFKELYENNGFSNIKVVVGENSDHASFSNSNIDSITFSEDDSSKIHTSKDTLDNIIPNTFNRNYVILNKYITNYCYDNYCLFIYNNIFMFSSLSVCLIFFIICMRKKMMVSPQAPN